MKNPCQLSSLFVLFALLAGGCSTATTALWDRKNYHPASDPKIQLAFAPQRNDILVLYDECLNYSTNSQRRAYWLFASTNSPSTRSHPVFVEQTNTNELQNVPFFFSEKARKKAAPVSYSAMKAGFGFVLWHDNQKAQEFRLPNYSQWGDANAWRVALTPLSVTGDAVLTTGAIAGGSAVLLVIGSDGQIIPLAIALAAHH